MSKIDSSAKFLPIQAAVLTVSDSRAPENDLSGDSLQSSLEGVGHKLQERCIVKDELADIRQQVKQWIHNPEIDAILITGGTGITGRDVTPEAIKDLFDKEIPGFGDLFRQLSYEKIGTACIHSRACAGVAEGTYIFSLPGSPKACQDAWQWILAEQLDSRCRPCNFVQLMPRLQEHL